MICRYDNYANMIYKYNNYIILALLSYASMITIMQYASKFEDFEF